MMLQATRRTVPAAAEATLLPSLPAGSVLRVASMLLLVAAALGFVVVGGLGMQRLLATGPLLSVQVEGELRHTDRAAVAARLAPVVKGNYFSIDLDAVRQAALASPWVDDVRVSRRWPDGLRVQLREKQPVARWGEAALVSSRGDLFVPASADGVGELPVLFGPQNKGIYVMEQYRAMNGILRGIGMRIVELELSERMTWFLRLDNGVRLVVDQADTLEKLQRFAYLYERQLKPDAARISSVDLRYRNGVAVGWKMVPGAAAVRT